VRGARVKGEGRGRLVGGALVLGALAIGVVTLVMDDERGRTSVRTAAVKRADLTSKVLAQGKVRARTQVEVASEIGGRISQVEVEVGDIVKQGDLLFSLDDEQLKNGVEQLRVAQTGSDAMHKRAQLALQEAERALERDTRLKEKGVLAEDALKLTQSRLELARADLQQAGAGLERTKLDLNRARDTLRRARVTAPAAGTVVAVGVEVGQVVSAVSGISASGDLPGLGMSTGSSAPVVIADLSELLVKLEVDEIDVGQVKEGQPARVSAQGIKDYEFEGVVERVGLMGREQGGAVLFVIEVGVKAVVPAQKAGAATDATNVPALPLARDVLRPGMSAQADIEVEKLAGALTVPVSAVLEGDGEEKDDRVFVVDGSTAKETSVKLGPAEEDRIAILSGLKEGDVVVEGPFRALRALTDGDVVTIDTSDPKKSDKKDADKGASSEREQP
jgi:HlyD family secretion protein